MLRLVLLIVHIACAALLFGAPLGLVSNAKKALSLGEAGLGVAAADAARRAGFARIGSLGVLLTGVALIFNAGGFAAVSKNFHAALGLMLGALVFSMVVMGPNTARLIAASQATPGDMDSAHKALKKLAMGSGILHLIWVVTLVLMFVRF